MPADFIDSNVFVYLFDTTNTRRRDIARETVQRGIAEGRAIISFQLVVASALEAGSTRLLTEDLQDGGLGTGQVIGRLTVKSPFQAGRLCRDQSRSPLPVCHVIR